MASPDRSRKNENPRFVRRGCRWAPVGGVFESNGDHHSADEKLEGGPSVHYDAVEILPSAAGVAQLEVLSAARDFRCNGAPQVYRVFF